MPRTRRQAIEAMEEESDEEEESDGENATIATSVVFHYNKPQLLSNYVTNQFYELHQQARQKLTCIICMEDVPKCCLLLPLCGHVYHYKCFFSQQIPECAMCRPSQSEE